MLRAAAPPSTTLDPTPLSPAGPTLTQERTVHFRRRITDNLHLGIQFEALCINTPLDGDQEEDGLRRRVHGPVRLPAADGE